MINNNKLKYLFRLIDDPDDTVRDQIHSELIAYGPGLEKDIKDNNIEIPDESVEYLIPIFLENRKSYLLQNWHLWKYYDNELTQLEFAMKLLEDFQHGVGNGHNMSKMLDSLSNEFKKVYPQGKVIDLANFLFKIKEINGTKEDYYNPLNSSIIYALQNGNGLPITLAVIFMLTAGRLSFVVEGVNFPGHFLTKIKVDEEILLIDGFNGGKVIHHDEIKAMVNRRSVDTILKVIDKKTNIESIVTRILQNLVNAYNSKGDEVNSKFFKDLIANQ